MDKNELGAGTIQVNTHVTGSVLRQKSVVSGPASGYFKYKSAHNPGKFVRGVLQLHAVTLSETTVTCFYSYKLKQWNVPNSTDIVTAAVSGQAASAMLVVDRAGPDLFGRRIPSFDWKLAELSLVKAYDKLNRPDAFDVGVLLGELPQTFSLLRKPLNALVRHTCAAKFRPLFTIAGMTGSLLGTCVKNLRRSSTASRSLADLWLEYLYGWRPLAMDIGKIVDLYNIQSQRLENTLRTKKAKTETTSEWSGTGTTGADLVNFAVTDRGTVWDKYVAGVNYKCKTGVESVLHSNGLSARDIPNVAWELIPFSFVVDWFYNIGPWINASMPNPSVEVLGNFISRKCSETASRNIVTLIYGSYSTPMAGRVITSYRMLDRVVNRPLPALPSRKFDLADFRRLITSCSLLLQRIPTGLRRPRR